MDLFSQATLQIVQTFASLATAVALIFAFWQVRLGARQIKKQTDKSSVEFVLDTEGQLDGMHEALLSQDAAVAREIFAKEMDPHWNDVQVKAFLFLRRYYGHVSRLVYLARNDDLDIGMTREQRIDFLLPWQESLAAFKDNPIMQRVHANGVRLRAYNDKMLQFSTVIFGSAPVGEGTRSVDP